ncbi:3711_t:CDS:1, partial [Funneliformis mosseae]
MWKFFLCLSKRHEEAAILLAENDRFFPPVTKGKDGHFLNLLHILEYCDKLKYLNIMLTVLLLVQTLTIIS